VTYGCALHRFVLLNKVDEKNMVKLDRAQNTHTISETDAGGDEEEGGEGESKREKRATQSRWVQNVCMYVYMHIAIHVFLYVCVCIHVYIYVCMYVHVTCI